MCEISQNGNIIIYATEIFLLIYVEYISKSIGINFHRCEFSLIEF